MPYSEKIFISHSSKDNDFARVIAETLHIYGRDIWYDERNLGLGQFRHALETALTDSGAFLLLLSENALQSYWVSLEINAALTREATGAMTVVLAIISPCTIPLLLSGHKLLDFTRSDNPVTVLKEFLRLLDTRPISTQPSFENARQAGHSTPPTGPTSYSIGTINAKNVNIHRGDQTYNFYGNSTFSSGVDGCAYIAHSKKVIAILKQSLDSGNAVDIEGIETFIKIMYTIYAQRITISTELREDVRQLCKRLQILSFM